MKIAVMANLSAGGGKAKAALERLSALRAAGGAPAELVSVKGYGAEHLPGCRALTLPAEVTGYTAKLYAAADLLAAEQADCLYLFGGDGIGAYMADAFLTAGHPLPKIVGVGCGTANVGPIINLKEPPEDPASLRYEPVSGLEILDEEGHVAWAFNDVVLGNTYLATVNGQTVTASSKELVINGRVVPEAPMADIGEIRILKNGALVPRKGGPVCQLILSVTDRDRYYGRAVTGLLCFTPDSPYLGAALLSERGIVSMEEDPRGFTETALMEQLLFTEEEELTLEGLKDGVFAAADGNPCRIRGAVRIRCRRNLLQAAF